MFSVLKNSGIVIFNYQTNLFKYELMFIFFIKLNKENSDSLLISLLVCDRKNTWVTLIYLSKSHSLVYSQLLSISWKIEIIICMNNKNKQLFELFIQIWGLKLKKKNL